MNPVEGCFIHAVLPFGDQLDWLSPFPGTTALSPIRTRRSPETDVIIIFGSVSGNDIHAEMILPFRRRKLTKDIVGLNSETGWLCSFRLRY